MSNMNDAYKCDTSVHGYNFSLLIIVMPAPKYGIVLDLLVSKKGIDIWLMWAYYGYGREGYHYNFEDNMTNDNFVFVLFFLFLNS